MTADSAEQVWGHAAAVLREQVTQGVWSSTFADVVASRNDDGLVLAVPNRWIKDRIQERYLSLVQAALTDTGASAEVRLEVRPDAPEPAESLDPLAAPPTLAGEDGRLFSADTLPTQPSESRLGALNPKYSFETFVIGPSNRFAHAAALAAAERPALAYNPLFIFGDAGLGKTHLLQAIAHFVRENYPNFNIRYVNTEMFLNDYVESIRNHSNDAFRRRYREQPDLLLVDDIQFIEKKEGFQDEFFHTFNTLYESSRQIVMTSDRSPDHIPTLEDRLRTRFKWGLIADIQPPDFETRLAILRKKAERETVPVPMDVLAFIAESITDSIRELEGALTRVAAFATLTKEPLTVDLAQRALAGFLPEHQPRQITPQVVLEAAGKLFGFDVEEIIGKTRTRDLVDARHVAMYVCRQLTNPPLSFPQIAKAFGGRDHTTVMNAVQRIERDMKERRKTFDRVNELTTLVRHGD